MARDEVVPWSRARTKRPLMPIGLRRLRAPPTARRTRDLRRGQVGVHLGRLARLVPAELGGHDGGHARRDAGAAIAARHREAHASREHVVQSEGQLFADGPGHLGLELRDVIGQRPQQVELAPQRQDVTGLRAMSVDEGRCPFGVEAVLRGQLGRQAVELVARRGAEQRQAGRRGARGWIAALERHVHGVAGHEPVGGVLAAGDPHQPRGFAVDGVLAADAGRVTAGRADERSQAGIGAQRVLPRRGPARARC